MSELWNALATAASLPLVESQTQLLHRYLDVLEEHNQRINLTRITERSAAEMQHIGDALTLLPYLPKEPHQIADVGSGGGVPGIPLAIVRPECHITLIEATKKKAAFLRTAIERLQLPNVTVLDQRAEDVANSSRRESFNIVVCRAVARLIWLAEWCLPLVKIGGNMLAMKGQKLAEELPPAAAIIIKLGGESPIIHAVTLPGTEHRTIVQITKHRPTPRQFPRAPSSAKGNPLI